MPRVLSKAQKSALEALKRSSVPLSPADLGEAMGTSAEGAAQTTASLVRRGLVVRTYIRGRAVYSTPRQIEEG